MLGSGEEVGEILRQIGNRKESFSHLQKAFDIRQDLARQAPESKEARLNLADVYDRIGDLPVDEEEPALSLSRAPSPSCQDQVIGRKLGAKSGNRKKGTPGKGASRIRP